MSNIIALHGTPISEPWSPETVPYLDQPEAQNVDYGTMLTQYRDEGYAVLPGWRDEQFMQDLEVYEQRWRRDNGHHYAQGYGTTGYMESQLLQKICCTTSIAWALERILGEEAGLHLNLTNWRSTTRNWHQDGYLNPDHVGDHYVAAWIAVEDIDEEAGPFEFIPGSHRLWDPIRMGKMLNAMGEDGSDPDWPRRSERWLTPFFEEEIERRGLVTEKFIAKKGEVLIWHPRLLHRGSEPINPHLDRKAIIAHYSGVHHRLDMPYPRRCTSSNAVGQYFPIGEQA